jgi:K319L-like, PKD domain
MSPQRRRDADFGRLAFLASIALGLSACGGGGGGDASPPSPVVYSGNLNAAVITRDSARELAAAAVGSAAASVVVAGKKIRQRPASTPGAVALVPRLNRYLRDALRQVSATLSLRPNATPALAVNETDPCEVSGTVSFSGTLSDTTGTGTLSVNFASCTFKTGVLNGPATFRIDAVDLATGFPTATTTSFSALQVKTLTTVNVGGFLASVETQDVTASGSLQSQVTIATNHEVLSGNLVMRDNASGKLQKVENLMLAIDYDNVFFPSFFNLSVVAARVFDDVAGYVDSTTTAPWFFPTVDQIFPSSGGKLTLTGAQNAQITVTPASASSATLELDLDGDNVFDLSSTMPWTAIGPPAVNTAPLANAGSSQSVPKGVAVTLDGSGSTDAEFDFLTFQWMLVQKPNGSGAQLSGVMTVHPTLTPDLEGSYVVNLVVSDGNLNSTDVSITLTAFNIPPIAKTDPQVVGYGGIPLVLDGGQSSDGNNDPLTFSWSLVQKPQGSGAMLSGANSATPSFTPDVIGFYRLTLTVNDGTADSQAIGVTAYAVTKLALTPQRQVPGDHPTIQAAIDAASQGDVIAVAPGTYTGNLRFNGKDVTLQSTDGPSRTIIKGVGDTAVDIGPNGGIIGFTIRDGIASFGGGMMVHGTGSVIRSNVFTANTQTVGGFGAAIGGNSASPQIDGNIFRSNSCQNDNQFLTGIISFVNTSSPTISNNVIANNPCRAINMTIPSGSAPLVINNTIVSNLVGIHVDRRVNTVQQVFRNNVIVANNVGLEVVFGTESENPTWQNNLVFGNGVNYDVIADQTGLSGNLSAEPLFVDQAAGVYFPNMGSPLIDTGTGTAPATDFFGRVRPIDGDGNASAVMDIGAFEFLP